MNNFSVNVSILPNASSHKKLTRVVILDTMKTSKILYEYKEKSEQSFILTRMPQKYKYTGCDIISSKDCNVF